MKLHLLSDDELIALRILVTDAKPLASVIIYEATKDLWTEDPLSDNNVHDLCHQIAYDATAELETRKAAGQS